MHIEKGKSIMYTESVQSGSDVFGVAGEYASFMWKAQIWKKPFQHFHSKKKPISLCLIETIDGSLALACLSMDDKMQKWKRKQFAMVFGDVLKLSANKRVENMLKCIWNKRDGCILKDGWDRFDPRVKKKTKTDNVSAWSPKSFDSLWLFFKCYFHMLNSQVFVKWWCWSVVLRFLPRSCYSFICSVFEH